MKFTMNIPLGDITPGEFQTAAAVSEMAKALEASQIDACYVTDHPAPCAEWLHANGHDALDPFTAFAFVAAATMKLLMHSNIIVLPYRNPFITAKAAATLQVLSGNRLILGVGGGYQKVEFEALGVDFHKRGALLDEGLEVLRLAWAGGPVVKQGTNFNAAGNEPRPVPEKAPPIWIGGGSDKAVERAARVGDGWCPFFAAASMTSLNQHAGVQSVAHLREKVARLTELRAAQGRTGPFDIAIGAQTGLEYGSRDSAGRYLDALGELAEAGVTWTSVSPPHPTRQAYIENVQWFAEEVGARIRSSTPQS